MLIISPENAMENTKNIQDNTIYLNWCGLALFKFLCKIEKQQFSASLSQNIIEIKNIID